MRGIALIIIRQYTTTSSAPFFHSGQEISNLELLLLGEYRTDASARSTTSSAPYLHSGQEISNLELLLLGEYRTDASARQSLKRYPTRRRRLLPPSPLSLINHRNSSSLAKKNRPARGTRALTRRPCLKGTPGR